MLRRNALIFHSGALGDFVLSWPVALALGRIYAQSRIFYVAASQKGALAERALRIESVDVENGWQHLFVAGGEPPENVTKLLDGSHAIFSFIAGADSTWAKNVERFAPHAKRFFIDPNPPAGFSGHATEHLLNQLESDQVVSTAVAQMLRSVQDRGLGVSSAAGGPVVIHPGAGGESKRWPIERFVSLSNNLRKRGRDVQIVLGEVELERWTQAQQNAFADVASVVKPKTLVELFATLSRASLVIGNDSGPAHLAATIGVPTIALFGPTDPNLWHPIGPRVHIVKGDSMDAITVQQVEDLIQ